MHASAQEKDLNIQELTAFLLQQRAIHLDSRVRNLAFLGRQLRVVLMNKGSGGRLPGSDGYFISLCLSLFI